MGRGRGAPIPQHRPRPLPPPPRRTLADVIMEKITEKQTEVQTALSELSGRPMPQLDPRVLEVYRGVREVRALRPPGPQQRSGVVPPQEERCRHCCCFPQGCRGALPYDDGGGRMHMAHTALPHTGQRPSTALFAVELRREQTACLQP